MTHSRIALAAGLFALSLGAHAQTASQKVYIVQLADAPVATYVGGVSGIAATRPASGAKLDSAAPNVRAYVNHLAVRRSAELAKAGMRVTTLHNYSYTFNGFSALLTDAQAQALKKSSGVASVVESKLHTVDTTRTPGFLGLTAQAGFGRNSTQPPATSRARTSSLGSSTPASGPKSRPLVTRSTRWATRWPTPGPVARPTAHHPPNGQAPA